MVIRPWKRNKDDEGMIFLEMSRKMCLITPFTIGNVAELSLITYFVDLVDGKHC